MLTQQKNISNSIPQPISQLILPRRSPKPLKPQLPNISQQAAPTPCFSPTNATSHHPAHPARTKGPSLVSTSHQPNPTQPIPSHHRTAPQPCGVPHKQLPRDPAWKRDAPPPTHTTKKTSINLHSHPSEPLAEAPHANPPFQVFPPHPIGLHRSASQKTPNTPPNSLTPATRVITEKPTTPNRVPKKNKRRGGETTASRAVGETARRHAGTGPFLESAKTGAETYACRPPF